MLVFHRSIAALIGSYPGKPTEATADELLALYKTNLLGPLLVNQALLPLMNRAAEGSSDGALPVGVHRRERERRFHGVPLLEGRGQHAHDELCEGGDRRRLGSCAPRVGRHGDGAGERRRPADQPGRERRRDHERRVELEKGGLWDFCSLQRREDSLLRTRDNSHGAKFFQ